MIVGNMVRELMRGAGVRDVDLRGGTLKECVVKHKQTWV